MLEAEVQVIELVALGEGPLLAVGIGINPARCFRQVLRDHIRQHLELIAAGRAVDAQGPARGGESSDDVRILTHLSASKDEFTSHNCRHRKDDLMGVRNFIKRYFCRRPSDDEPTKAEIMEDIRIGLRQAAAGEGRPAREALEESDERGPWYAQQRRRVLKFIKFQRQDADGGGSRCQRALSKSEADALMDVCVHDTRPVAARNTALLRLMVYTGLRRAEMVALRWGDIDLDSQTLRVVHGKGGKERFASIADITNVTKRSLEALWLVQGGAYQFVFTSMTVERSGVGHISAHDLRRTHITLALDYGAPLQDMQTQAGHASSSTTLRYAQAEDAKMRRERIAF